MNILLAGGGGFIGSHLADTLIDAGHYVTVVDNFCSSHRRNVSHLIEEDRFELIEQDILEPLSVNNDIDYVLHLASRASPMDYQNYPIHTLRTNAEGTLSLLHLAHNHNADFLYASTSEVYGDPEVHPQTEDYWGNVNPTGPRACYDEAKRFGETSITSFARKKDIDYRILRIFNTYGPRMRPDDGRVITNFATQALDGEPITVYGDGTQTRSFCYISDLVRGIHQAMNAPTGEILNLGNPDEYEIIQVAEIIKELTASNSEIVYRELPQDDPEKRRPDISKARRMLSWEPEVSFRTGLEETVAYLKDQHDHGRT